MGLSVLWLLPVPWTYFGMHLNKFQHYVNVAWTENAHVKQYLFVHIIIRLCAINFLGTATLDMHG